VQFSLRRKNARASEISSSTKSRSVGLLSTIVTSMPESGEHRGVLDADHAGADDEERPRELLQREDAVRVDHGLAVDGHGRRGGLRPDGDDDVVRLDLDGAGRARHRQRVRPREFGAPGEEGDPVPLHLGADDVDLARDDLVAAEQQVVHRDVVLHGVGRAVVRALGDPAQVEDGFAERLGGIVPVFTQTPPTISRFSQIPTFFPSLAAWTAARWPAGPVPRTKRSNLCMSGGF
jgi:hypothetical protein